jgi:hypothetical protein
LPTDDATQIATSAASTASAARPRPMTRISLSLAFPVIVHPPMAFVAYLGP